jgi:hypothetical protein
MKIFGISWGLIALVLIVAVVVKKYGNSIPGIRSL